MRKIVPFSMVVPAFRCPASSLPSLSTGKPSVVHTLMPVAPGRPVNMFLLTSSICTIAFPLASCPVMTRLSRSNAIRGLLGVWRLTTARGAPRLRRGAQRGGCGGPFRGPPRHPGLMFWFIRHCADHVGGPGAARDQKRLAIDPAIPHLPRGIVASVPGLQQRATKGVSKLTNVHDSLLEKGSATLAILALRQGLVRACYRERAMNTLLWALVLGLAMVMLGAIRDAPAQTPPAPAIEGPIYAVTYVEVLPSSRADGVALLQRYRDATRGEDGNQRCEVLSRIGQPHQLVLLEVWRDAKAFEAHGKSAASTTMRERIHAIRSAPIDERVHVAVAAGPLQA